jgi:hypothetical protein
MPIFLKVNHQLESRMRESRLSGSEGGATHRSSLPYQNPFELLSPKFVDFREDFGRQNTARREARPTNHLPGRRHTVGQ